METEVFAEVKSDFDGFRSGGMSGVTSGRMSQMSTGATGEGVNLDEAFTKVNEMLQKIEQDKIAIRSNSIVAEVSEPKRHKGRRVRKATPATLPPTESLDLFGLTPDSANSSRSSGYQSQYDLASVSEGNKIMT